MTCKHCGWYYSSNKSETVEVLRGWFRDTRLNVLNYTKPLMSIIVVSSVAVYEGVEGMQCFGES